MGFLKPPKIDVPGPEPVPPPFVTNQKPQKKQPMAPTFLGAEKTPVADSVTGMERGKTLLGQ